MCVCVCRDGEKGWWECCSLALVQSQFFSVDVKLRIQVTDENVRSLGEEEEEEEEDYLLHACFCFSLTRSSRGTLPPCLGQVTSL